MYVLLMPLSTEGLQDTNAYAACTQHRLQKCCIRDNASLYLHSRDQLEFRQTGIILHRDRNKLSKLGQQHDLQGSLQNL